MFATRKRLLEEVRKAKLEGIAEGKQDVERQVDEAKERGIKEGYNRGWTDRTNYYTMSVIPELEGKIIKKNDDLQELEMHIRQLEEEQKKNKETIANYEVANKSLREIGERLMFRVGELKDENKVINTELGMMNYIQEANINCIAKSYKRKIEELKLDNDLYDFQEIKRLEQLMKKVKRVKVKKKIQSRIDKLMIKGL